MRAGHPGWWVAIVVVWMLGGAAGRMEGAGEVGAGKQPAQLGAALTGIDLTARSLSLSKQFFVYCSDTGLRTRVSSLCEDVKGELLTILGERDHWKFPIVITIQKAETAQATPVRLSMVETPDGATIQIDVRFGANPSAVHLQKQIVRAVLLEFIYRERGPVVFKQAYVEAPWWMVEGALLKIQQRDLGINSGIYKGILESKRLPLIDELLQPRDDLGETAGAIDAAYARCLLGILIEQPAGRANLARFLQRWPDSHDQPLAALTREFPNLGTSANALQKWWTLNIARLSVLDRFLGLTVPGTESELNGLLQLEVVDAKTGGRTVFSLKQYRELVKLPKAKPALEQARAGVVGLGIRANALFRPVLSEYEQILGRLIRGKTGDIPERLASVEALRKRVLQRAGAISDYLNWYEATQLGVPSKDFESFMRASKDISAEGPSRSSTQAKRISEYLDQLEAEF